MMLLRGLNDLYDRLVVEERLPQIGYQRKPVRFVVELDANGHCLSIIDTGPEGTERLVPDIRRSGKHPPPFIGCDNGQYVLGLPQRDSDESRAKAYARRAAFLDRLNEAAKLLEESDSSAALALRAIAAFVSDRDRAVGTFRRHGTVFEFDEKSQLRDASSRIGFMVDGVDPTELSAVRDWWATVTSDNLTAKAEGLCQVSGKQSPLARIMPGLSVKRGTPQALISANFAAAERYNAKQSGGAQVSVSVAIHTHQALNWLLADKHHHRRIGGVTFVWWLATDVSCDPVNIIADPHLDDVAALLAAPWTGRPGLSPSDDFRLLGLSLTEGRVVIRFDHVSTLAEVERHTHRWLQLVARQRRDGSTWWPAIWQLADAAVPPGEGNARKVRRDRIVEELARAAVAGTPLPRSMLAALIDRCRAVPVPHNGRNIDWSSVGGRIACLNLYVNLKESRMKKDGSVGDLCGRILAQLEAAQYRALGDTNRTIVDRYYAGASTMPNKVFPGLFRTANAHLAKVGRSDRGKGAQIAISRRLGQLCALMVEAGGIPATLNMEQQADFALGYWDERQARFQGRGPGSNEATNEEE